MIEYKILVQDSSGNSLGEFENFRNLQVGKRLNNYGVCSFEVPVENPKAGSLIALRQYTVWIYRNGVLIWAGEQAIKEGNLNEKRDNWAKITCYDWFEQFNSRYTSDYVRFEGIDAGQIAWSLIDTSQSIANGDFGVTEGDIEPTQDRDRTYINYNISEAIVNLSNVLNGFDFEINNSKVFNVKSLIGVDRTASVVLEYGINITNMRITEDFSHPVNKAIELGDSGYYLDPLRVVREDTISEGIYGIRENLDNEMSIIETTTLEDKGDAILRKYGTPLFRVTIGIVRSTTPTIEDFSLGDIIRMKVKNGFYNIDETFRIYEWQVNYNTDNTEVLNLTLGNFIVDNFS